MTEYIFDFQEKFNFEQRKAEASRIIWKHPNRIPIILEKDKRYDTVPDIDKKKFLVPRDLTMGQFQYVVRKRLKALTPEKGLFFFVNNSMMPVSEFLSVIYDAYKHDDGFLYILYSGENTFG